MQKLANNILVCWLVKLFKFGNQKILSKFKAFANKESFSKNRSNLKWEKN